MPEQPQRRLRERLSVTSTQRLAVVSRVTAALVGGYAFAYASAALLTVVLPMGRVNRVVTAGLLSFLVWVAVAIGVFAAGNSWRSWWPLLVGSSAMLALAFLFRDYGMRP